MEWQLDEMRWFAGYYVWAGFLLIHFLREASGA